MVHGACLLFTGQRTSGGSALIWVFSHTINNKSLFFLSTLALEDLVSMQEIQCAIFGQETGLDCMEE